MKEITGSIFHQIDADAICVTTNGVVKANGELVMGAGIALIFAKKWPSLPIELGNAVKKNGNIVHVNRGWTISPNRLETMPSYHIVSFPTKHHWKDKSNLELIRQSAEQLVDLTNKQQWKKVVLPRPGCGLGQLDWETVKAVIEPILDDRFYVIVPK